MVKPATTDGPHDPNMDGPNTEAERLKRIAAFIEDQFGGKGSIGFYVVVVPFDTHNAAGNYISNIDRKDVIDVMEARLRRFKQMARDARPGRA